MKVGKCYKAQNVHHKTWYGFKVISEQDEEGYYDMKITSGSTEGWLDDHFKSEDTYEISIWEYWYLWFKLRI
jgi:hypothetical protein